MYPNTKSFSKSPSVDSSSSHLEAENKKQVSAETETIELSDGFTSEEVNVEHRQTILDRCGHGVVTDGDILDTGSLPSEAAHMIEQIEAMSTCDAVSHLRDILKEYAADANFPLPVYERMESLVEGAEYCNLSPAEWSFQCKLEAGLVMFHSPYPEIRGVTDPIDDPSIPVETIRAYILGFFWTIIGAGVNEFFMHRKPQITLSSSMIQLLLYPCGKFLALTLPDWGITIRGIRHSLNPGPWTYKEQMFATIIFNVAISYTYVSHNIYMQKLKVFFYTDWIDFGYEFLLMAASQFLGFGLVGIVRRFAVYEQRCIWPTLLPTLALNRALLKPEKKENIHGWTLTRYKFFAYFFSAMFLYNWVPSYLFEGLSTFSWMTWIKPENFNLAAVSGEQFGLGMNPLVTFDWNIIDYNYSLTIPFFSQLNQYIGTFIGFFVVIGLYYSNYKWTAYLPINDNDIFTNTGERYNVSTILDSTSHLVEEKYREYSPPFYSAGNLLVYGAFFALYPFGFFYTIYHEWSTVKLGVTQLFKNARNWKRSSYYGYNDPHSRMMSKYKEVPDWCYLIILIIAVVLAIICVKVYPAQTPVWGIFFIVGLNAIFLIPICIIYSTTGFALTMNVLTELIIGYALPGNGLALNTLKSLSRNIDNQAETYISDQKLAHYAKIPPRAIFRGQIISTFIQIFVALGVINWQIANIPNICTSEAENKFTCPKETNFYSAGVFWGVIGPKKVFSELYPILQWTFLIGFLAVIPCILIKKKFSKRMRWFSPTLIIGGMLQYAPYNLSYVTTGLYVSFTFMYYIKSRYTSWWEKYNYVLAAAFSSAVAFSAVIIFFSVKYHPKSLDWWGNNIVSVGVDGGEGRQSLKDPLSAPDGYFGPRIGSFS